MQFPPKKESTLKFYKEVIECFNKMHNVERIRYDDCLKKLANKFHKTEFTIEQILKLTTQIENYESTNIR